MLFSLRRILLTINKFKFQGLGVWRPTPNTPERNIYTVPHSSLYCNSNLHRWICNLASHTIIRPVRPLAWEGWSDILLRTRWPCVSKFSDSGGWLRFWVESWTHWRQKKWMWCFAYVSQPNNLHFSSKMRALQAKPSSTLLAKKKKKSCSEWNVSHYFTQGQLVKSPYPEEPTTYYVITIQA